MDVNINTHACVYMQTVEQWTMSVVFIFLQCIYLFMFLGAPLGNWWNIWGLNKGNLHHTPLVRLGPVIKWLGSTSVYKGDAEYRVMQVDRTRANNFPPPGSGMNSVHRSPARVYIQPTLKVVLSRPWWSQMTPQMFFYVVVLRSYPCHTWPSTPTTLHISRRTPAAGPHCCRPGLFSPYTGSALRDSSPGTEAKRANLGQFCWIILRTIPTD